MGIAVALLALGAPLAFLAQRYLPTLRILPFVTILPGLAFLVVGSYRAVAGKEPEDGSPLRRIGIGVLASCGSLVLLAVALVCVVAALGL